MTNTIVANARPRIRHHKGDSRCGRCGPGWGVIKSCNAEHETVCGKCKIGSYSPHHSFQPCWICSRCGPGLYEAHPCTGKTDTVCDSCHRHVIDNDDYRRKCRGHQSLFLAPEDAQSTGDETSLVNENNENIISEKEREIILEDDIRAEFIRAENFQESRNKNSNQRR
ncbi:hypothetical protein PV326_006649 [Microctonus aethiopoides]|uniref:TNFR-Cys domain-containing protein n=1 Tax=Microctonus aethiopoides TaxID=144406 RepID=A0AA39F8S2_9HYME|nr:hypothetical protein PV326_006649 [Microctonus aethiopoides]KAK0165050.1 hypothetical protein PV328_003606 [Microctonus aethiopoides]